MATAAPGLELAGQSLGKRYGGVVALHDVGITLQPGSLHAIIGENGAGKSTLAKILAGVVRPDSGGLSLSGRAVKLRRRAETVAAGVGFVPQASALVGALSLVENAALGGGGLWARPAIFRASLQQAGAAAALRVPLDVPSFALSLAERQLGEVLVALAQGARILLLDEPTSLLGPHEILRLMGCLRALADGGVAIGLVTHRIAEVLDHADQISVLRGGRLVHQGRVAGLDAGQIAEWMVGTRSRTVPRSARQAGGMVRLAAEAVGLRLAGQMVLHDISFTVQGGQVLGIAGVAGAAQPALVDILAGITRPTQGRVRLDGTDITNNAASAMAGGLAHIPDDRAAAIPGDHSIAANASLLRLAARRAPKFRRFGLRRRRAEAAQGAAICASFDVRPNAPALRADALSGGNQQKLLVGRELERNPGVVVAHNPTQGLDLAAAAAIRRRLADAAAGGAAVLVISTDLDELAAISHHLAVLSNGRIVARIDLAQTTLNPVQIGHLMAAGASA